MRKKIALSLIVFVLIAGFPIPEAQAKVPVSISAPSAVLFDSQNNRILLSKTPHQKRAPASTTKILTAMVVIDSLPMDRVVTIPKFAESVQPSKVYLRAGEKYNVRNLLRATLISSANDAAEVLAVAVAGSRSGFAKKMNKKARAIGAKHSHFVRPSGLPAKNQYSTAYDMAQIMKYAQRYPFIISTLKKRYATIRSTGGRRIKLRNHNKMLWKDKRELVGKTGWTTKARHCFVGQMKIYDRKVLVSVLGSHSLWRDLTRLLDFQFGTSYYRIKKNQKIWATHEIRKIQIGLKKAGFNPGPVDGKFGPKTLTAVEKFQKAKGLSVDGIVGTNTWKKLSRYL